MKIKQKIGIFLFLIIICVASIVQAVNNINIKITLPQGYKQENSKGLEYYEKNKIYLHAVNENKTESIIVVQLENDFTRRIANLAQLNELNFNVILEQYNKEKEQTNQTKLKQETYRKGELLFIDTVFEHTVEDKTIQTEEYYTMLEGKAIVISMSFLGKPVDANQTRQIIDSIEISKEEQGTDYRYILVILVMAIILMVVYTKKQAKVKPIVEETKKKTILQKIEKNQTKIIKYHKFKGVLVFFAVTLALNCINLLYTSIHMLTQYQWQEAHTVTQKFYVGFMILQNVLQLIGFLYIAYSLTKKQAKTITNIKKTFLGILMGITSLTIFRAILQGSSGINSEFATYLISEMKILAKSVIYILIWYVYFENAIRVSVYYEGKSLSQIIEEPKKGYQTNFVNKRIIEYQVIEYFETQKAIDYASGIYMNKLPKEYTKKLAQTDLTSKKVIRLKRAKYYLDKKKLENPKVETRKTAKTVAMMVLIYVLVMLLISSF